MFQKLIDIRRALQNANKGRYHFKNISHSVITIINRSSFKVDNLWFDNLLHISYDEEIKRKYIPELHEINDFERDHLNDILEFQQYIGYIKNQLEACIGHISEFKNSYRSFYQMIDAENISVLNEEHPFLVQALLLNNNLNEIEAKLLRLKSVFETNKGYKILSVRKNLTDVLCPIADVINFRRSNWSDFLNKEPESLLVLHDLGEHHDQIYYGLNSLNRSLDHFKAGTSYKIIVGNAGTGKTHISAHLTNRIRNNGDYVLFFKAKQFNGDNINLADRLLQLLQVPPGYTLNEILDKINNFTSKQNKRCFIIIDALNETTKSSIGFSNIWENHLQDFTNQVCLFSHLYLICTLRTSYIDRIWDVKPSNISELKGFERVGNLMLLCKRYFEYYKIKVSNFAKADLNTFKIPLLLDLYCKLINENRTEEKEITLDMKTYLQIFGEYIDSVSSDVQRKLDLQKKKLITAGFKQSSEIFYKNNEAIISVDEFNDAFDADDGVTQDNSIARAVLEGYLIFIKDVIYEGDEIVKHTQQEVGGYLLAKYLSDTFSSIEELLRDEIFREKIIDADSTKQHQLRLDIQKFLIAMHPEIILQLNNSDSLSLSWWYLYNGFSSEQGNDIPDYLISLPSNSLNIDEILRISSNQWFNPDSKFNFHFIAKALEKLDLWSFDLSWTFFIYKEAGVFYEVIKDNIGRLKETELTYDKVIAKFAAFTTATNIRELRDIATIYLIEFGKKHPIELLELTEYSTSLSDNYIYERLASCCYGVSLILQNDNTFIKEILPEMARRLFQLQFASDATDPVFNYIVIDSIKHLIGLAIHKDVFTLSESERTRLNTYQFPVTHEWKDPSKEQKELINSSQETSWPEPIGMDFGIYTIPRLINGEYSSRRDAIANVYKRIFELGFKISDDIKLRDELWKAFYFGYRLSGYEGKVDKLGKKYLWKGFFDYAGFLLLKGKLNVFETYSGRRYYQRLSDVDIDVCLPSIDYKLAIRLYEDDLIANRENSPDWYRIIKIDSIASLQEHLFEGEPYIMLHGMVEQRINEEYKTRSYLLIETCFIKKNQELNRVKKATANQVFDWDVDIHFSPDHLSRAYFGELYWSDNMVESSEDIVSVPTGEDGIIQRRINIHDIFGDKGYSREDIGREIDESRPEKISFDSEPTVVEYLWESDSDVLNGYSEYYPSIKMGKTLGLRAEPKKARILDPNLKECYFCINFKDNFFQNTFNYMRSDLLRKYMTDNNLALLYQVKQHSYDEDNHQNRAMKFFILE